MKKLKDFTNENLDVSSLMDTKELSEIIGGDFLTNINLQEITDPNDSTCRHILCAGGSCRGGIFQYD